jgi:hypothetical protein
VSKGVGLTNVIALSLPGQLNSRAANVYKTVVLRYSCASPRAGRREHVAFVSEPLLWVRSSISPARFGGLDRGRPMIRLPEGKPRCMARDAAEPAESLGRAAHGYGRFRYSFPWRAAQWAERRNSEPGPIPVRSRRTRGILWRGGDPRRRQFDTRIVSSGAVLIPGGIN